jgi:hypothetical protein
MAHGALLAIYGLALMCLIGGVDTVPRRRTCLCKKDFVVHKVLQLKFSVYDLAFCRTGKRRRDVR